MATTKIIQDPQGFQLPSKWEALPQNARVVDRNGTVVGKGYMGERYTVLCDAKLSQSAYNKRRFNAILAIIFTLGIAYFCSDRVKSLLAQKHRLYIAPREVTLKDAEEELKMGINIPQKVLDRIQELIPKISKQVNDDEISMIDNDGLAKFTIPEAPEFLFTLGLEPHAESLAEWFKTIVLRKQVIMKYRLNLLQIPDTALVKNGEIYLMVERGLSYDADPYFQEDLYYSHQEHLKLLVKQLAKFFYEAKVRDADYLSFPLLKDAIGSLKCAILNMDRASMRGHSLIYMMPNEELIDIVIEEAKKFDPDFDFMEAKEYQMRKIANYNAYQKFLEQRKIQRGDEPVVSLADMNSVIETLGFKYGKSGKRFSRTFHGVQSNILKEDVRNIIINLNEGIRENGDPNKRNRRFVPINISTVNFSSTERESYLVDMGRILEALRKGGYIFDYKKHEELFEIQC